MRIDFWPSSRQFVEPRQRWKSLIYTFGVKRRNPVTKVKIRKTESFAQLEGTILPNTPFDYGQTFENCLFGASLHGFVVCFSRGIAVGIVEALHFGLDVVCNEEHSGKELASMRVRSRRRKVG